MFIKLKKKLSLLLLIFILPINVLAYSDYIIASGENIGIELNAKGIIIVGTYETEEKNATSSFKIGDIITKIENKTVSTIDEMANTINEMVKDNQINITFIRNGKEKNTVLKLSKVGNIYKTGLYVKDSITGIGTLTYIDPNTKLFGALGHEIIEKNSGILLEIKDGKIFSSTVTGIESSTEGSPGEKNARYDKSLIKGSIFENTTQGIFGNYFDDIKGKLYKVGKEEDIHVGKAMIRTVMENNNISEYEINIKKINHNNQKNKNFVFEITDEKLLTKTGGIIQGMSGSPIIQDEKIVGAVTHVVVDHPEKGYGIFITNMLKEAEN